MDRAPTGAVFADEVIHGFFKSNPQSYRLLADTLATLNSTKLSESALSFIKANTSTICEPACPSSH
jgi:hypothetical protein